MQRRCCIVVDNGQRIIKEENGTIESMDIKAAKEKFNIKYNKIKTRILKKIKGITASGKRLIKAGAVCTAICVAACALSFNFTSSYTVYLGGEKIGIVANKDAFNSAYNTANEIIAELDSEYAALQFIPDFIYGISLKNSLTSEDELKNNIVSLSRGVKPACFITVDGNELLCVKSEQDAKNILENIRLQYGGEESQLVSNVALTNGFANVKNITDAQLAGAKLSPVIKVQTVETVTYEEPVYFGIEYVSNDEMYEGESTVVSAGSQGSRKVTAKITKINGVETAREVVSSGDEVAATPQVVAVGTKERTGIGIGEFIQPAYGTVTSRFGARWGGRHNGLDIANDEGSPVEAADNGVVTFAGYYGDFGNLIILNHNNGYETYYAHLSAMDVSEGDIIVQGQKIGEVGNTGFSTGPHLHFEVRKDGVPYDPSKYLN